MPAPAPPPAFPIRRTVEVAESLGAGRPVVVLESSVLAQGLPIPANREAARRMEGAVRAAGAVPAVSAVVAGVPTLGLEPDELERFLARTGVRKVSARDLAVAMVQGADGATTVAASLALATAAGCPVFATGGIGGVHRELPDTQAHRWVRDESADLVELARSPVVVVCAGAKSILDLPATLERLETLGVPVVGYRTDTLPGFLTRDTGLRLPHRVESPGEVAAIHRQLRRLGRQEAVLVVQPLAEGEALPRELVDRAVGDALDAAAGAGVEGAAVTPYLLAAVERATGGRSLAANLRLLEANGGLAARIAVALAGAGSSAAVAGQRG